MVLGFKFGLMALFMKVNGSKVRHLDMEGLFMLPAMSTLVSLTKTELRVRALTYIPMALNILVNGRMMYNMVKG